MKTSRSITRRDLQQDVDRLRAHRDQARDLTFQLSRVARTLSTANARNQITALCLLLQAELGAGTV